MIFDFHKYQGTGNDFILIDNREKKISLSTAEVAKLCDRRLGIGADGLILLNPHPTYDFEMKNYNADGSLSSFCGNGARTLVQFASDIGIKKDTYLFLASDGAHEAKIEIQSNRQAWVHLKMTDVTEIKNTPFGFALNTGSPHLVCPRKNLDQINVLQEGRALRNDPFFAPEGINVNFIEAGSSLLKSPLPSPSAKIRTYERGVEDETLSCGTGAIAAALVNDYPAGNYRVEFSTRGGTLAVEFEKVNAQHFKNIWLIGPALLTFTGRWKGQVSDTLLMTDAL